MNVSLSGGFAGANPLLPSASSTPGTAVAAAGGPADFSLLFTSVEGGSPAGAGLPLSAPAALATNTNLAEEAKLSSSTLLAPGVSALVARFMTAPAEVKSDGSSELPAGEASTLPEKIADEQTLPQPEFSSLPQMLGCGHLPRVKTNPGPEPAEVVADDEQATGSEVEPAPLPRPEVQQPIDRPAGPILISQPDMQLGKPEIGQPIGHLQPEPIVSNHPVVNSGRGLAAAFRPALVAGAPQHSLPTEQLATDGFVRNGSIQAPQSPDALLTSGAETGLASPTSSNRLSAVAPAGSFVLPASDASASATAPAQPLGAAELASLPEHVRTAPITVTAAVATDTAASSSVSSQATEQRPIVAAPAVGLPEAVVAPEAGAPSDITASLPPMSTSVTPVQQPAQGGLQAAAPVQDAAPAPRADDVIERQLDMMKEGEWLDRLARDITATAGRDGLLKFKLHPETLGSLHVEVARGQDGTSLRFTAESEAARALIADAQPRLVAEARAQGLRLAETHVDLGNNGAQQQASDRRGSADTQAPSLRTAGAVEAAASEGSAAQNLHTERFA